MNIELSYLRYFYEVARQGSFMAASKSLKVSQPGISKIVKKLEDDCGTQLFHRTKKGVFLTEDGRIFLSACEKIQTEVGMLGEILQKRQKSLSSEICFGVSDNICNYIVPKAASRFTRIHPNVRMKIYSGRASDITREIMDEHIDFGILFNNPARRGLEASLITQVQFSIVLSAETPVRNWRELPHVGLRAMPSDNSLVTLRLLKSIGVEPRTLHEVNSQEAQKQFVLEGMGYALLPHFMVQAELAASQLREIEVSKSLFAPLYMIHKSQTPLTLASLEFLRSFRSEAQRMTQGET
jgi:DNA-binding transcriptional LysR family regulator